MPDWIVALARRIVSLPEGVWCITLIVERDRRRWVVTQAGKLEG